MNKKRNPTAVFQALGQVLLKYPEFRVGQAVMNALPARFNNDAFYIEDDELAECLRALADGQPSEDRLIAPQPTREGAMRALHFPNEHGDCPSWCAGCQSAPPPRCFFPDCQCVSTSLGDCKGEHYAPEVEQVKRELVRLRAALEKAKGPIAIAASYADAPEVSLGLRVHARDCARILPEINAALAGEGEVGDE